MASPFPQLNPARLRTYIFRLPFFTRIILIVIVILWVLELQSVWNVVSFGALIPKEVGLQSMYRLNTYPLIHLGFFHAFLNTIAITPLLERFEAEHGTLLSAAMFVGPLSTLPAAAYLLIERVILRGNTAIMGASVWVFVLLGAEAIKAFRANPYFAIGANRIPTWSTPLIALVFVTALVPNTSFLGHLCSLGVGYIYALLDIVTQADSVLSADGLGYLKVLAPPEKILRWVEGKLNLLGRLPHYVSIDQKTYGRYGVLPTSNTPSNSGNGEGSTSMSYLGSSQRLGS